MSIFSTCADGLLIGVMKTVVASVIGRTPRQLAWRRFRRNRFGLPALVISLTITFVTLMTPIVGKLLGIDGRERFPETLSSRGMPIGKFGGISWSHPLGIEPGIGHDLLARLLFGARISFFVALITTVLSITIGVVAGILMGFFRGRVDSTIGRFIDFLLAFPSFFMIVALSLPMVQRLEKSGIAEGNTARMLYLVLILIFFGWPYLARVIRSQVLSIRERDYVMAARALGASNTRIIFKEILPNLWSIIIVYFSLSLPGYLTAEAVFSFLGLGIQPPDASWGLLISDSIKYVMNAPTYFFITTISLVFVVLTFNLLGDAVRDALDPKSDIT
jgi:ABC-type dipeptide/oligopeptide/nickel transport system permease subunit